MDLAQKVQFIFQEIAGERALTLRATYFPANITSLIRDALAPDGTDEAILSKDQIAFHLTDWQADAAFIVALHLFPERFTPEDIRDGVESFLLHVPAHILAAARLGGYGTKDIFSEE